MELSYRWRKRAFVTLEMCFINSSWSSRRGGIAAECPQPQTALWLNHIYYSAKPEPFVETDVRRLRCFQVARLASRIRAFYDRL